jgi:hypothetical protein
MKTFNRIIASALALSMAVACYDDGTDFIDNATRITMTPGVEQFNADGTLVSGNESFVAAVVINQGQAVYDMAWKASVVGEPSWVEVKNTEVTTEFKEAVSGKVHYITSPGIEIIAQANPDWKRKFTLVISTEDKTEASFEFEQLGAKPDALVESAITELLFMSEGGSEVVTYTSNMGDVYKYDIEYGARYPLRSGISLLLEGVGCPENLGYCNLSHSETEALKALVAKLEIPNDIF